VRAGLTPYMQEFALVGTPEQIAEHVAEKVLPQGIGGLVFNMPFSGHVPGTVQAIGQTLTPLVHGYRGPMNRPAAGGYWGCHR
jgi:alkanesulfonate monooxygenase SsuD/methylene tetrahydromethanopterin reductase-like flavin-dependent oxidoreductase (luciferase family)